MNKQTIITAAFSICFLLSIGAQAKSEDKTNVPTISVTKLDINDKALNLDYVIRNDSEEDAWIFVGGYQLSDSTFGMGAGVYVAEEGRTLTIRMHFKRASTGGGFMPVYRSELSHFLIHHEKL